MPCLGLSPFLQDCIQEYKHAFKVSMPCLGLSPFLPLITYVSKMYYIHCVNALSRAITISTEEIPIGYWNRLCVSMPCLGLSPFLRYSNGYTFLYSRINVSMPCLGLSPFLRSPLGTRINRGHNLETIHVIVRQFSFAPIFTPFFPSLGISALFHLKWFVSRHFYYTCFCILAQGVFCFSACLSVSWPLIFP